MTEPDQDNPQVEQDGRLEKILQTVRSIDRNVQSIHEMLSDQCDAEDFYDEGDIDDYFNHRCY